MEEEDYEPEDYEYYEEDEDEDDDDDEQDINDMNDYSQNYDIIHHNILPLVAPKIEDYRHQACFSYIFGLISSYLNTNRDIEVYFFENNSKLSHLCNNLSEFTEEQIKYYISFLEEVGNIKLIYKSVDSTKFKYGMLQNKSADLGNISKVTLSFKEAKSHCQIKTILTALRYLNEKPYNKILRDAFKLKEEYPEQDFFELLQAAHYLYSKSRYAYGDGHSWMPSYAFWGIVSLKDYQEELFKTGAIAVQTPFYNLVHKVKNKSFQREQSTYKRLFIDKLQDSVDAKVVEEIAEPIITGIPINNIALNAGIVIDYLNDLAVTKVKAVKIND